MKGRFLIVLLIALLAVSCEGWFNPDKKNTFDRVMILYSAGCNSIGGNLEENVEELKRGFVPGKKDKQALVVISHRPYGRYTYKPNTSSYIIRLYKDKKRVVSDTLKTIEPGKFLTQPAVMKDVLGYVRDNFKSDHYGLVYSSHATGWLPEGYYLNPVTDAQGGSASAMQARRRFPDLPEGAVPYVEPEYEEGLPRLKSIGQEDAYSDSQQVSYEMSQADFVASIPMHLDYIIFDACLMGCIETAYELRGICDKVAFSPAEILEFGFQYETLASHLLQREPDVYRACKDYFDKYDSQSSTMRSATITLVDCTKLDQLAAFCKELVSHYRTELAEIDPSQVQPYFRSYHHWFYDLEDIFLNAGIIESDKKALELALAACTPYKAATPSFYLNGAGVGSGFKIDIYSGYSMYLPCNGSAYLDEFYKTLAWNKAVGLVQ